MTGLSCFVRLQLPHNQANMNTTPGHKSRHTSVTPACRKDQRTDCKCWLRGSLLFTARGKNPISPLTTSRVDIIPVFSPLQQQIPQPSHELCCTNLLCGAQGGSSVLLLLHSLCAPQPPRAARGDEPDLASRGSVPADGRGLPDVLVVASSEGMLHRLCRGKARQQCNHRN